MAFGFPELGNLCSLPREELDKTNVCIKAMLQQRQKDLEYSKQVDKHLSALADEKVQAVQHAEKLERQLAEKQKALEQLQKQQNTFEERSRKEREKLSSDKEELAKRLSHLQSQQSKWLNDIRKKEKEVSRLQDQVRTCVGN
jgi:chromosome segregation ATPase